MAPRFAINGFGRIGRNVVRAATLTNRPFELVGINDITDAKTLAHLLKYDSIHGKFPGEIEATDNSIKINGREVKITAEKDPALLPWKDARVDVVLECTGKFTKKEQAAKHITAGARKVIISAPANDADITLVYGVNHDKYIAAEHDVVSNGSCTTNCLAPVVKVLLENFGIVKGLMTTVHSYTNDQNILDLPHKDLRRARAACMSMIPTSTGAAKALALVIPEVKGKLDGMAIRVPTPDVSVVDLVIELEKNVTKDEINKAMITAANGRLKGVLGVTDEPLVSIDFIGSSYSSVVDLTETMVIGDRMAKILMWYDNEMGFSYRMCDMMDLLAK